MRFILNFTIQTVANKMKKNKIQKFFFDTSRIVGKKGSLFNHNFLWSLVFPCNFAECFFHGLLNAIIALFH